MALRAAAIQMVSGASVAANLEAARSLLTQAAREGAQLAVLPEYFCLLGHQDTDKLAVRETDGEGAIQDFLADCARVLGLWLVGGTLPLRTDDPLRVLRTARFAARFASLAAVSLRIFSSFSTATLSSWSMSMLPSVRPLIVLLMSSTLDRKSLKSSSS